MNLLALEELRDLLYLLPGFGHGPFAFVAFSGPGLLQVGIGEVIGAVVEVVTVAVDGHAIGLAVPGADGRLEILDIVVDLDLLLDPVRHLRRQTLAADIALEGCAHFQKIEIDRAGRDRLLQARVVIGLGEIDPGDLGARVGLPGPQETAEQEVVQILVVQPHEGQFDALELALLHARLGGAEAQFADLLPIRVRRRAFAHAGNLEDLGQHAVLRGGGGAVGSKSAGGAEGHGADAGRALQEAAPIRAQAEKMLIILCFHVQNPPSCVHARGARCPLNLIERPFLAGFLLWQPTQLPMQARRVLRQPASFTLFGRNDAKDTLLNHFFL